MTRLTLAEAQAMFGRRLKGQGYCAPCANDRHRECERKSCLCPKHGSKYRAQWTTVDGHVFHSKKEAARYGELLMMQRAKRIRELLIQIPYDLAVNGVKVCRYIADFSYVVQATGATIVEDVKGLRRGAAYDLFRIKKALMMACHGIDVIEV